MGKADAERFGGEAEELAVSIETPRAAGAFDLQSGLVRPVEELVIDSALVVPVCQRQRLGAVPLQLHDRDRAVREDPANAGTWS